MFDLITTMVEKDLNRGNTYNLETQYNIFRLAKHVIRCDKNILKNY